MEIWLGWILAGILGAVAGWLLLRTNRLVLSHRRRVARLRENWDTVEERLAEALKRVSELEAERALLERELARINAGVEELLRQKEELSRSQPRAEAAPPKSARRTSDS